MATACIGRHNWTAYQMEGTIRLWAALSHLYCDYYGHRSTHSTVGLYTRRRQLTSPAPIVVIYCRPFRVAIHRDRLGQQRVCTYPYAPAAACYGPLPLA